MTLASGTHLGSYEVLAPIGAGGMGEVYRAHGTKLERDVAIKMLPEAFAHNPETLSRQRALNPLTYGLDGISAAFSKLFCLWPRYRFCRARLTE